MSGYAEELDEAERQGLAAYEAMEAWLSRPIDEPGAPGALLERYAMDLRESRERIHSLLLEYGIRDDIEAALERSQGYHHALGLSLKDRLDDAAGSDDVDDI